MSAFWSMGLWVVLVAAAPTKEALYRQAMSAFQQKQFRKARARFAQLLPLLRAAQRKLKPKSRAWTSMQLGLCYNYHKLAQAEWSMGKQRESCRRYLAIRSLKKGLPQGWKSWANPVFRKDLLRAMGTLEGKCKKLPAEVRWKLQPSHARVSLKVGAGWKRLNGAVLSRSQTRASQVVLRFEAKGFATQLRRLKLPAFAQMRLAITLRAHRKVRPLPPAKAAAFYKTWWFWTLTGAVVLGSTTAAILALTAQPRHVLKPSEGNEYYRLWP